MAVTIKILRDFLIVNFGRAAQGPQLANTRVKLLKACCTPNVQVTENAAFDGWKGNVDING